MKKGDLVRENWSSVPGTIVKIKLGSAGVKYPSGRVLWCRLEWLVPVEYSSPEELLFSV